MVGRFSAYQGLTDLLATLAMVNVLPASWQVLLRSSLWSRYTLEVLKVQCGVEEETSPHWWNNSVMRATHLGGLPRPAKNSGFWMPPLLRCGARGLLEAVAPVESRCRRMDAADSPQP